MVHLQKGGDNNACFRYCFLWMCVSFVTLTLCTYIDIKYAEYERLAQGLIFVKFCKNSVIHRVSCTCKHVLWSKFIFYGVSIVFFMQVYLDFCVGKYRQISANRSSDSQILSFLSELGPCSHFMCFLIQS